MTKNGNIMLDSMIEQKLCSLLGQLTSLHTIFIQSSYEYQLRINNGIELLTPIKEFYIFSKDILPLANNFTIEEHINSYGWKEHLKEIVDWAKYLMEHPEYRD